MITDIGCNRGRHFMFNLSPLQAAPWYYCWCRCRKHSVSSMATASLAAVQREKATVRISVMKRQSKTPACINK